MWLVYKYFEICVLFRSLQRASLKLLKRTTPMAEKQKVCVTGAGGFIASWLVKFLLSRGYTVHGTVRDPCKGEERTNPISLFTQWTFEFSLFLEFEKVACIDSLFSGDEKNDHLRKLDNAAQNLKLFKADLFDYEGLFSAIDGCSGVFHIASPVPFEGVPLAEASSNQPLILVLFVSWIT